MYSPKLEAFIQANAPEAFEVPMDVVREAAEMLGATITERDDGMWATIKVGRMREEVRLPLRVIYNLAFDSLYQTATWTPQVISGHTKIYHGGLGTESMGLCRMLQAAINHDIHSPDRLWHKTVMLPDAVVTVSYNGYGVIWAAFAEEAAILPPLTTREIRGTAIEAAIGVGMFPTYATEEN